MAVLAAASGTAYRHPKRMATATTKTFRDRDLGAAVLVHLNRPQLRSEREHEEEEHCEPVARRGRLHGDRDERVADERHSDRGHGSPM